MLRPSVGALYLPLFALASGGLRGPWLFSAAAVFLWGAAAASRSGLGRLPGARLWWAWLLWAAVSAALSAEPLRGAAAWAHRFTALAVLALASSDGGSERNRNWERALLGAALVIEAVSVLVPVTHYPYVGVLFPYYNYTSALAAVAVVVSCGLLFDAGKTDRRLGAAALLASLVWLVAMKSRGGMAVSAFGIMVFLLRSGRTRAAAALAGSCLLGAAVLLGSQASMLKLDLPNTTVRPKLWLASVRIAMDSPWFGEGPGQYDRGFLRHKFPATPSEATTRYGVFTRHAHSELLQETAETGFPGAALLAFAVLATLWGAWRRSSRSDPRVAAVAAMLAHTFVDNILFLPGLQWLFLAMLASAAATEDSPPRAFSKPVAAAGACLAAICWWPGWFTETARRSGNPAAIQAALTIAPKSDDLWAELARRHLQESRPREALDALSEAEALNPTNALYPLAAAQIAFAAGRWSAVESLAGRVLALEPRAGQARLLRTEALLRLGRKGDARAEFERFLESAGDPMPRSAYTLYEKMILGYDAQLRGSLGLRL